MLKKYGNWMELGSADQQKPAKDEALESWERSPKEFIAAKNFSGKKQTLSFLRCIY